MLLNDGSSGEGAWSVDGVGGDGKMGEKNRRGRTEAVVRGSVCRCKMGIE